MDKTEEEQPFLRPRRAKLAPGSWIERVREKSLVIILVQLAVITFLILALAALLIKSSLPKYGLFPPGQVYCKSILTPVKSAGRLTDRVYSTRTTGRAV